ncbi:MAG: hypothetical protein HYV95_03600 [Opitutae bacterium]|nr:hypothetical protein [Opitutae bacterium]
MDRRVSSDPASAIRRPCGSAAVRRESAFTLFELVLALALMALVGVLFVDGAGGMFQRRAKAPEDSVWAAVSSARAAALQRDSEVSLRFEARERSLRWFLGDAERSLGAVPVPDADVEFLPVTSNAKILLGGELAETGRLEAVRFYPDGSCDAFKIQLSPDTGARALLRIDPWTCAPVFDAPSP